MRARLLALTVAVLAVVACEDITRSIEPNIEVTEDTLTVFTLRGSPLSAPTALDLFRLRTLRVGEAGQFYDIAVDTSGGAVVLYPSQLIDNEARPTGILEVTSPFEDITEAPMQGYVDTAAVSVLPGETVVIRARNVCSGNIPGRDFFYAKVQLLELGSSAGHRTA
ncbi:MAG: hypothetical protein M3125_01285, partial [Gemmatimonadota bacterium]|nr:hypothetical protein [Gemmatimonadota bacterium]